MPYISEKIPLKPEQDRRRKLSDEQVEEIKKLYGTLSQRKLAKQFGVSRRLIILYGKPGALEHHKALYKERRKDGRYYDKKTNTESMREHRSYKQELYLKGELGDQVN